jgi:flagellar M-ring protein FliF
MKELFQRLLERLGQAGPGTKALLAAGALAILGTFGFAAWKAERPSFRLLYSALEASETAAIQGALAGAGIRYQVSQPPGPFVIHVEEGRFYEAQNAVALSGALTRAPEGIQAGGGGAASVFLSAGERAQGVLKREWQELERQLQGLDFVTRASVSTSAPRSPFARQSAPPTVAVMLALRGGTELTREQAATVAKLVRFRFGVPAENVMISDQSGRALWDGGSGGGLGSGAEDLFEHKRRFDEELAQRTNEVLDAVFGQGKAYVLVNSEWSHDESETVSEKYDPKGVVVSETKSQSETPQGAAAPVGGPAGLTASLNPELVATGSVQTTGEPPVATTSEERRASLVGRETRLERRGSPTLGRLSVSLFLDDSLQERLQSAEQSVKASVGFDAERGDLFSSLVTPFASLPRDESGALLPPEKPEPLEAPSPMLEMLLGRGVEIAAGLAFLFVLLRALKGARAAGATKGAGAASGQGGATLAEELDEIEVERLARARVEELLRSDPDKVGSILSRWAAEEVGAGR